MHGEEKALWYLQKNVNVKEKYADIGNMQTTVQFTSSTCIYTVQHDCYVNETAQTFQ